MSQRGYIGRWQLDESGVIKQRRTEGRKNERSERRKKIAPNGEKMAREELRSSAERGMRRETETGSGFLDPSLFYQLGLQMGDDYSGTRE